MYRTRLLTPLYIGIRVLYMHTRMLSVLSYVQYNIRITHFYIYAADFAALLQARLPLSRCFCIAFISVGVRILFGV